LQRQPSLLPYQPPPGYDVSSVPVRAYLEPGPEVAQPRLVDIWTDVDPTYLPRTVTDVNVRQPGSAIIDPRQLESAALVSALSATVAHQTRLDFAYARTYGMTSSGIRPTLVGVPSQPGLALPSVTDVASSHTRVRSDTPMPLSDVGQRGLARPTYDLSVPTASDVAYTLSSGNVDVIDIACTPGPSSVDVPRPASVSVHRPMPAVGVRPPKSSVPVDVVGPLYDPAPPTRVDIVGQQRLGRPLSVNVAHYPGPPSASVDVEHQPYSSMSADVVRPTPPQVLCWPGVADVVPQPGLQPAVSADGASSIVGPLLADVVHQPGAATADAVTDHPSTWTATRYVAARANAAEFASVGTMTAKSLRRLDRLTASSDSSPHSRVIEWLHTSESMPPPYSVVEPVPVSDRNRHCPSVPRQWCRVHALLAFLVFHIPHAVPKV